MPARLPTLAAACALVLAAAHPAVARAACDPDQAMARSSDIGDVLSDEAQSRPDEASRLMRGTGAIMGAPVTDETCTRLDAPSRRARAP